MDLVDRLVKKKRALEPDRIVPPERQPAATDRPPTPSPEAPTSLESPSVVCQRTQERPPPRCYPSNRAIALMHSVAWPRWQDIFAGPSPTAPVSYLVQRAVRWGEMPLEAWLQEVIHSDDVLSNVRETLGLTKTDDKTP